MGNTKTSTAGRGSAAGATQTGVDYRFSKILRALALERKIGLMAACEALLQEHPEYSGPDALCCRATAKAMVRAARLGQ